MGLENEILARGCKGIGSRLKEAFDVTEISGK